MCHSFVAEKNFRKLAVSIIIELASYLNLGPTGEVNYLLKLYVLVVMVIKNKM